MTTGNPAATSAAPAQLAAAVPAPALSPAEAARALRQQRARRTLRSFLAWVILPTLLSAVYLNFVASPQFDSEATLAVRGPEAASDAAMLREYVRSRAAFKALNHDGKLKAHYQAHGDVLSKLSADASDEAFYRYMHAKVEATYDTHAGVLNCKFRAFSGEHAHRYMTLLLGAAQKQLDGMRTLQRDNIAAAEQVVSVRKAELVALKRASATLELSVGANPTLEQRAEMEALSFEQKLAEKRYESALVAADAAQALGRPRTEVAMLSEASAPDLAAYPKRAYGVLTTFLAAFALFGIGSLLLAAVREHAQF